MTYKEAWIKITNATRGVPTEICLSNKINAIPQWFTVYFNGSDLIYSSSALKMPRADINQPTPINAAEFELIFAMYFKKERKDVSPLQDYVFATIEHFCFKRDFNNFGYL